MQNILISDFTDNTGIKLLDDFMINEKSLFKVIVDADNTLLSDEKAKADVNYFKVNTLCPKDLEKLKIVVGTAVCDVVVIINRAEFHSEGGLAILKDLYKLTEHKVYFIVAQSVGYVAEGKYQSLRREQTRLLNLQYEFVAREDNEELRLYRSKNFGESYKIVPLENWWN